MYRAGHLITRPYNLDSPAACHTTQCPRHRQNPSLRPMGTQLVMGIKGRGEGRGEKNPRRPKSAPSSAHRVVPRPGCRIEHLFARIVISEGIDTHHQKRHPCVSPRVGTKILVQGTLPLCDSAPASSAHTVQILYMYRHICILMKKTLDLIVSSRLLIPSSSIGIRRVGA